MHQLSWLFVEVISWVPFLKYILKNSHICLTKVFENCIETEEKTTKLGFGGCSLLYLATQISYVSLCSFKTDEEQTLGQCQKSLKKK